jgi:hypothetical protein
MAAAQPVPPVRPASMYAAKFRGGPGPGTYEQPALIITPRGSPRGTFGTGPQRAIFGKEAGPPPDQYSPRKPGKVIGEYSFSKDSRFKGGGGTGDPGAYNPRPRSEGRAPAAYSIKVRHPTTQSETPGPGAHDIARFGDASQHSYDSFHRLAQNSSRFSFGSLARPLGGGMSPQQARRLGRPDPGSPRGGWLGGSGRSPKRSAARGAAAAEQQPEPQPQAGEVATTPRRQMHGRAGRHPLQPASDTRRFAPEERPAHGTVGPMDPPPPATQVANVGPGQYETAPTMGAATDVRFKSRPRFTILTKKEETKRFLSKEHSDASMMSTASPGPALYGNHLPLGVGVPATVSAEGSSFADSRPGPPMINSGRFVRGVVLGADKRRAPAFGFGTASRDAPGSQVIVP